MANRSTPTPDQQELKLLRASHLAGVSYRNSVRRLQQVEFAWRTFSTAADPGDPAHEDHQRRMQAAKQSFAAAELALANAQLAVDRFHGEQLSPAKRRPSRCQAIARLRTDIRAIETRAAS